MRIPIKDPQLEAIQKECDKHFSSRNSKKSQRDSWVIARLIKEMRDQRDRDKDAQLPLLQEIETLRKERDEWKEKCIKLQSYGN